MSDYLDSVRKRLLQEEKKDMVKSNKSILSILTSYINERIGKTIYRRDLMQLSKDHAESSVDSIRNMLTMTKFLKKTRENGAYYVIREVPTMTVSKLLNMYNEAKKYDRLIYQPAFNWLSSTATSDVSYRTDFINSYVYADITPEEFYNKHKFVIDEKALFVDWIFSKIPIEEYQIKTGRIAGIRFGF